MIGVKYAMQSGLDHADALLFNCYRYTLRYEHQQCSFHFGLMFEQRLYAPIALPH